MTCCDVPGDNSEDDKDDCRRAGEEVDARDAEVDDKAGRCMLAATVTLILRVVPVKVQGNEGLGT